jgi:hypothetical protein
MYIHIYVYTQNLDSEVPDRTCFHLNLNAFKEAFLLFLLNISFFTSGEFRIILST